MAVLQYDRVLNRSCSAPFRESPPDLGFTEMGIRLIHRRGSRARRNHSGLMPFASMNVDQFLISASSLVRNAEPGA